MRLEPTDINAWRAVVRWCLRGIALVLLATGVYLCLKRLIFGVGVGELGMALRTWTEIGEGHSFSRGAAMIVVGLALSLLAGRLSRWIVTVPAESCPRCGYAQMPKAGDRCSECGLRG